MTIGIILIFYNYENQINKGLFSNLIRQANHTSLCLVNNGSLDKTLEILKSLNEEFQSNLTIVDIKKNKGTDLAIKAGARYLKNTDNLKYIGYLNLDPYLNLDAIDEFLKILKDNKELIIEYNTKRIENRQFQRMWFKDLFSITNFFRFFENRFSS